ncbi:MAG TPA: HDIG domain-containing protein [Acidimicrobiia bacterium]|nr:HDIG domain-containing protein [Acidimicrobiia bacterium]
MPGSLSHLARRFFDVLLARPLDQAETSAVENWLDESEATLFFSQPEADQRHGYHAALVVLAAGNADGTVLKAALLHDVGKRHARLGVMARSLVSVLIRLRLPLSARGRQYRDHGETAARELGELGCDDLIVDFARHHHEGRPPGIPEPVWDLLQRADEPPKTGETLRSRIS